MQYLTEQVGRAKCIPFRGSFKYNINHAQQQLNAYILLLDSMVNLI